MESLIPSLNISLFLHLRSLLPSRRPKSPSPVTSIVGDVCSFYSIER
ncbi:hypothetical protein SOVF_168160 [Spinacia oleracea]|nr:hypothetical protein SOVF_168160 [Spinacia oleracea]